MHSGLHFIGATKVELRSSTELGALRAPQSGTTHGLLLMIDDGHGWARTSDLSRVKRLSWLAEVPET
jgi:hypothetical protein